jgi:transglutaminase-like putative cysteine protease
VGHSLTYSPGATKVDTTLDEVVQRRVGVCQDYAHLTVALCRAVALPARYVSGYLFARRDDAGSGADANGATDEPGEADAVRVQTHAWVEVAVAPGRWQPLDPTNGREVGERHVKIGHGRDYFDVTPFHGSFSGSADPTLVSSVDIRRRSGDDDRPNILSAADRGLLRRPVPQTPQRVLAQQQEQQQQ